MILMAGSTRHDLPDILKLRSDVRKSIDILE